MRRSLLHAVAGLLVLASTGCITQPEPPIVSQPAPTEPAASLAPTLDMSMPDLSTVQGRRICLDPGHSAQHPGATAPSNGLREADVNLRVALRVRDLLSEAGALVTLTRMNPDALDPKSNPSDLTKRAELANASKAEIFVSIHHNADIHAGSTKNDLEVYYRLVDDGPSLDLAQHCISALARRVRSDAAAKRLLPGNYKVLRVAEVPAVLLETSYLTHDGNAAFLATPQAVEAEALAIADGIAAYFARNPLTLESPVLAEGPTVGNALDVVCIGPSRPVADSAHVLVDGTAAPGRGLLSGTTLRWVPVHPFANGSHEVQVLVQNTLGAWSRAVGRINVNRPPASVDVLQEPQIVGAQGSEYVLRARVVDAYGLPVADGTPVVELRSGHTETTHGGMASFYGRTPAPGSFVFQAGDPSADHSLKTGDTDDATVTVRDRVTGKPIAGATVASFSSVHTSDAQGWSTCAIGDVVVSAPGYEAASLRVARGGREIQLQPRFGGVLLGKRVMLDPAYGGRVAGAIGPDGTRASDLSLTVARRMEQKLREAGADVQMTRNGDVDVPDSERVRAENQFAPDIYVRVSFGDETETARAVDASGHLTSAGAEYIGHYPGSVNGTRLARSLGAALNIDHVVPCYLYVVQQAGAPAVVIQPNHVDNGPSYRSGVADLWAMGDRAAAGIIDYFRQK